MFGTNSVTYYHGGDRLTVYRHNKELYVWYTTNAGTWHPHTTGAAVTKAQADTIRHDFCNGKKVLLPVEEVMV